MKPYMFDVAELTLLSRVTPTRILRDEVGPFPVYSTEVVARTLGVVVGREVALYWEPIIRQYDFQYIQPSQN